MQPALTVIRCGTMPTMETVGARVRRLREGIGISQAELARRAGVRQQAVNALELDQVKRPRMVDRLARALGVTSDYLLSGMGAEPAGATPRDYVTVPRWNAPASDATAGWMMLRRSLLEELGLSPRCAILRAGRDDAVPGIIAPRDLVVVDLSADRVTVDGVYLVDFDTRQGLRHVAHRVADGALVIASPSPGLPAEIVPVPQLARVRILGRAAYRLGEI